MSTVLVVTPRRDYGFSTVLDLTDGVEPTEISRPDERGRVTFTFGVDLAPAVADAVWARLDSTCDDDEAARAQLRADRAALPVGDPLRRLYDYVLDGT